MDNLFSGENIRRVRKGKKLSLKAFAEILDVSFGFLGAVERGDKEPGKFLLLSFGQYLKTGYGMKQGTCVAVSGASDKYDPRLCEIIELWGGICEDQRDTLLRVAQGFSKEQPPSLETSGGVATNYKRKSYT